MLIVLALSLATPCFAQEGAENAAVTRFLEAASSGAWEQAEAAWSELARAFPDRAKESALVCREAEVLIHLGSPAKKKEAADVLDAVLSEDPENLRALYLLARVRDGEAANLLVEAARVGGLSFREVF